MLLIMIPMRDCETSIPLHFFPCSTNLEENSPDVSVGPAGCGSIIGCLLEQTGLITRTKFMTNLKTVSFLVLQMGSPVQNSPKNYSPYGDSPHGYNPNVNYPLE